MKDYKKMTDTEFLTVVNQQIETFKQLNQTVTNLFNCLSLIYLNDLKIDDLDVQILKNKTQMYFDFKIDDLIKQKKIKCYITEK